MDNSEQYVKATFVENKGLAIEMQCTQKQLFMFLAALANKDSDTRRLMEVALEVGGNINLESKKYVVGEDMTQEEFDQKRKDLAEGNLFMDDMNKEDDSEKGIPSMAELKRRINSILKDNKN